MSTSSYFAQLTTGLREADIARPCLVLDLDRLDRNIQAVKARLSAPLRIVDKSLPCLRLIERVRDVFATNLVMTFHPPVTETVMAHLPDARMLFGKPMPVAAAAKLLRARNDATSRIDWLIDTPERLAHYAELAEAMAVNLSICFEVDIGLHRGGLSHPQNLNRILEQLRSYGRLTCSGIMAYEAHIGHIPSLLGGPKRARDRAISRFQQFCAQLGPDQRRVLNLGGSSTALTYQSDVGANEMSMGSAFVKPSDFDVPSLASLEPALFIAAPILKIVDVELPGLDSWSRFGQLVGLLPRRACYLYGGKWMARPVFPEGMKEDATFGVSSNQQFFALPKHSTAKVDDFAFLRATQSECVLQQFGTICVFSEGRLLELWPTLPMG